MLNLNTLIHDTSAETQLKKLINALKAFALKNELTELTTKNRLIWIIRFIRFHNRQHPAGLSPTDVESYLSSLAVEYNYNQAIQSQALDAIQFLYRDFLQIELGTLQYSRTKTRRGFSNRFGDFQCRAVLNRMQGSSLLMAEVAVLGKLKLFEVINLKLADVDIKKNRIDIRSANGEIKFSLNIPLPLILNLRIQLMRVRQLIQIKNQQFSSIKQINPSSLSVDNQDPSQDKENEYLFPVANCENPHISSRSMQLALLKNDISIAVKQYSRTTEFIKRDKTNLEQLGYSRLVSEPSKIEKPPQTSFNFKTTLAIEQKLNVA